jgi:hypothetical protein
MKLIRQVFPDVTPERVAVLVRELVNQRDFVATIAGCFKRSRWGSACLEYEEARLGLFDLAASGTHSWMRYLPEQGQAYTVMMGVAPIRVQSESDQFRPVMRQERQSMNGRGQLRLPGMGGIKAADVILRLEVAQRAGEPVARVTLCMFDESTNVQLDEWLVYRLTAEQAAIGPRADNVVEFRRSSETPEISDPSFLESESASDEDDS